MSLTLLPTLRRSARLLLRAAKSEQTVTALPALRRMHRANVLPFPRLVDAFSQRKEIRLKHALRTIAVECGMASWEALVARPQAITPEQLVRLRFDETPRSAYLNHWFADEETARQQQVQHGGHIIRYGSQALLCTDEMYESLSHHSS